MADMKLSAVIHRIFKQHKGHYGSPKITKVLRDDEVRVGQKRVARIMCEQGLVATKAKLYPSKKSNNGSVNASPNIVREIDINHPNQVWVGDITYIKLESGEWLYLSAMMDRFTRQIISWSVGTKRDAALTCGTLARAMRNRSYPSGVVFHSDKGAEYIADKFRGKLSFYGVEQSMNRKQAMNDNAAMESFFNTLKIEAIKQHSIDSERTLRRIVSQYIRYYNRKRIHMSIGGIAPDDCEILHYG